MSVRSRAGAMPRMPSTSGPPCSRAVSKSCAARHPDVPDARFILITYSYVSQVAAGMVLNVCHFHNDIHPHHEGIQMSKILAAMIAGLFAAGAYAQNPPGASSQEQV